MNILRIGRYRLLQRLGSGGSAEVYLAEDTSLHRKVALKLLRRSDSTDAIRHFQAEARCAAMLNHPGIVTVYDIGSEGEIQYIATEYIEGETLRQRMRRGIIPLPEVIDISIAVMQALVAAHEAWIVHRDIKPENIMLRRDGGVKVVDFSVSRLIGGGGDGNDTLRRRGGIAGTLHYLSPEQVRGEPIIDTRSDIYSFGVVLYEMLSGDPPFTGEMMDVLAKIVEAEPPELPGTVPLSLHAIVMKAIRKDMYARHQTAAELLDELNRFRVGLTLRTRKPQSIVVVRELSDEHVYPAIGDSADIEN